MSPDDYLFQKILIGTLLIFFPFAFYFRLRSQTGEKLDRSQEGIWILLGIRLGSLPWFLGFVTWLINPVWMNWASIPLPYSVRMLGAGLMVCWGLLLVWCFSHLGKNLTDTVVTREEHTLVKTGPYQYIRHPFYLAFFIAVIGIFLLTANVFLLVTAIVPVVFLIARTPIEEQKLVDRFGTEYSDYMKTTGRYLPVIPRKQG